MLKISPINFLFKNNKIVYFVHLIIIMKITIMIIVIILCIKSHIKQHVLTLENRNK